MYAELFFILNYSEFLLFCKTYGFVSAFSTSIICDNYWLTYIIFYSDLLDIQFMVFYSE